MAMRGAHGTPVFLSGTYFVIVFVYARTVPRPTSESHALGRARGECLAVDVHEFISVCNMAEHEEKCLKPDKHVIRSTTGANVPQLCYAMLGTVSVFPLRDEFRLR